MSAQPDVLAVLRFLASREWDGDALPGNAAVDAAVAAVAELIAADHEHDAARAAFADLNRRVAENGWLDIDFDALRKAGDRFVSAQIRRDAALGRAGGAA